MVKTMIVGNTQIDNSKLLSCRDVQALRDYALSLVPPYVRHIPAILDNQKWLVAVNLRKCKNIAFYKRTELANQLLTDVEITGDITTIISIDDCIRTSDIDYLMYLLFKEDLE